EQPAARLDVSKPLHVSEAPWFGPQRRWPDIEGEQAVDPLHVFLTEDTAGADVYTEWLPVEMPPSIDLPAILAASNDPAAIVAEEIPLDLQEALPAIDMVPIEESARDAVI